MTYRPNRLTIGYERAKVLNPWVFADLRQPQRMRGFVSPLVYQTAPPAVYHPNLSGRGAEAEVTQQTIADEQRALQRAAFEMQKESVRLSKRMAVVSLLSFGIAAVGLTFAVMDRAKKAR
jgi:hypothetical protein